MKTNWDFEQGDEMLPGVWRSSDSEAAIAMRLTWPGMTICCPWWSSRSFGPIKSTTPRSFGVCP
jgi:hypothetical protein